MQRVRLARRLVTPSFLEEMFLGCRAELSMTVRGAGVTGDVADAVNFELM